MTDAEQLKPSPCPFCGGGAIIRQRTHRHSNDGEWDVECDECLASVRMDNTQAEAIAAWNRRPNPSGDADVREKIVLELVEMHKLAIAVANAKRHDGIGSFGAEEDLCQAAVSLRLGNAMLNAAVEIERLALTGHASTDRAGDSE